MKVGIEKINVYSSSLFLELAKLAEVRNRDVQDLHENIMLRRRSVNPVYEDVVTMAVNAAKPILSDDDKKDIELLIVGTESAIDFGKPASTFVHRTLGLQPNVRNFETKHACYSSMAGFISAIHWVASGAAPGKKALVIASDFSRKHLGAHHEFVLGGASVAMLISANPQILEIELDKMGYWTTEIADTFRPTAIVEMGNNETSLYSYLDALEGALDHFLRKVPDVESVGYDNYFKTHLYHMPFPGMSLQAHRRTLNRFGIKKKSEVRASWEKTVEPATRLLQQVGSAYSGSTFCGLCSWLNSPEADAIKPGDRTSVYVYGSGSQGEFYSAKFGPEAQQRVRALNLDAHMADRQEISPEEYEAVENLRESYVDQPNVTPDTTGYNDWYARHYAGKGYLVLKNVENYYRHYDWS